MYTYTLLWHEDIHRKNVSYHPEGKQYHCGYYQQYILRFAYSSFAVSDITIAVSDISRQKERKKAENNAV